MIERREGVFGWTQLRSRLRNLYIGLNLCLDTQLEKVDLSLVNSIEQGFRALLICPLHNKFPCLHSQSKLSKLRAPFRYSPVCFSHVELTDPSNAFAAQL